MRVLQYLKRSGHPFLHIVRRETMCGSMNTSCPRPRPVFVHVARETADMPELIPLFCGDHRMRVPRSVRTTHRHDVPGSPWVSGRDRRRAKTVIRLILCAELGLHPSRHALSLAAVRAECASALLEELTEMDLDPRQRAGHRRRHGPILRTGVLRSIADPAFRASGHPPRPTRIS